MRPLSLREAGEAAAAPRLQAVEAPALLALRGVAKGFGRGASRTEVLAGVDLEVARGEFVAIVGFSGTGKSTLLNLLAGLAAPDAGAVLKEGRPVTGPGPDRALVFQSYALMPWLTVRENVALAVDRVAGSLSARERGERVQHYVRMVGLTPALDRKPAQLSGGMRQRVAVARALATQPDVLLLDEPLSALDALTRAQLQDEIVRIWEQDRKTVVLVTNDVDEALMLADRVITLEAGPRARLGRAFRVDLPRPRERLAMNHDPRFRQLRADITGELLRIGAALAGGRGAEVVPLPVLAPAAVGAGAAPPRPADDTRYAEFSRVGKVYPTPAGPQAVVEGFDLRMARGEFVSLIGHSGCGKSTVLSMMAGLAPASEGVIVLDGREVREPGPDRGVVFQSPSLVPWLTAYENVMLGVERVFPHGSPGERRDIAAYYLQRVGLGQSLHRKAAELSNGMRQRVGIARAFALQPKLLLLDEPFGMLDTLTRWELQEVLMEVWARNRVTALMVTHDVDEAILLADRVVMMSNGPRARVGHVLDVPLPRPRSRQALLAHPRYYELREEVIGFLAECGHQH